MKAYFTNPILAEAGLFIAKTVENKNGWIKKKKQPFTSIKYLAKAAVLIKSYTMDCARNVWISYN